MNGLNSYVDRCIMFIIIASCVISLGIEGL